MRYTSSYRFKMMLLSVIPLLGIGFSFIAHSFIIANQVQQMAASAYAQAIADAAAQGVQGAEAVRGVVVDMGWIAGQWATVFSVFFILCYIPITIAIRRLIMPIRLLADYADRLSQGNIDIDVVHNRSDELGLLQASFKRLAEANSQQAEIIERIAEGDISATYTPRSAEDVVGNSLVKMLQRNNAAMAQVLQAATHVSLASARLAMNSQTLSSGSSHQLASIEAITREMADMEGRTKESDRVARDASALTGEAGSLMQKSLASMRDLTQSMEDISQASASIVKIVKVIDDIAFQTGILALNASVEAARAGQQGKGFSVVADEVRQLAAKSADAAKETTEIISGSAALIKTGTKTAESTNEALSLLSVNARQVTEFIAVLADLSHGQSEAIRHVNASLGQVSRVTQENAATARESAASSESIAEQTRDLEGMVSHFKLRETDSLPSAAVTFLR